MVEILTIFKFFTGWGLLEQYGESSRYKLMDFCGVMPGVLFFTISHMVLIPWIKKFGYSRLVKNVSKVFADQNDERLYIFANRLYSLVFHSLCSIYCFLFFRGEVWWFFDCYALAFIQPQQVRYSFWLKLYYNIELSFVIYKSISLVYERMVKKIKKAFVEMLIHHLITLGLVFFSFMSDYGFFGVLVFFVHGFTDMFMYSTRCANDLKSKLAVIFLPLSMISWFIFRLFLFPYFIIAGTVLGESNGKWRDQHPFMLAFLGSLLAALYCLHVYWAYGLCRICYNVMKSLLVEKKIWDEPSTPLKGHNGEDNVLSEDVEDELLEDPPMDDLQVLVEDNEEE